jgi:hypothetical protein
MGTMSTATAYTRVTMTTLLTEDANYAVLGVDKEDRNCTRVAFTGTYDDCADYAERNESPDNYERYYVGVSA